MLEVRLANEYDFVWRKSGFKLQKSENSYANVIRRPTISIGLQLHTATT